ncbi:HTH-type transcriptional regulator YofA [compost metagenome]
MFQAVAEEGSISKAAQSLNYVQSNVTARIQQLEQELGTPLFYRHSRGITLTSAGQTLMEYTVRIFNLFSIRRFRREQLRLAPIRRLPYGCLRSCPLTAAVTRMSRFICRSDGRLI